MINKVLQLVAPIETKAAHEDQEELIISGYASTVEKDRMGDVIKADAWKQAGALDNYLKNPVVLAYHDMNRPIGRTIEHTADNKGLRITAKISKAAGDIAQLIKDGILSTFSIGFIVKDADYDQKTDIFVIKEVELLEVSVVTIPANAGATFSVAKNFSSMDEYEEFKKQFNKSLEISEEKLMKDEKDTATPIDVAKLADQIRKQVEADLEKAQAAKAAKAEAEAKELAKIEATATTAAEKLVKDLEKRINDNTENLAKALEGLHEAIAANKEEIPEVYAKNSKMNFSDNVDTTFKSLTEAQKDGLVILSKLKNTDIRSLKSFENYVTKSEMQHWDPGVGAGWEETWNTRVFNAVREQLVVERLFSSMPMSTPTMYMPINPEAGFASWVPEGNYRSSLNPADETTAGSSSGTAVDHQLNQNILVSYKLATREYVGYEEEEDSIVTLAPIINDAVARRMALSSDRAHLRGAGVLTTANFDPITGLTNLGSSNTPVEVAGGTAWETTFLGANVGDNAIADMRKNLGLYGLDPNQLVLIASHDLYYALMKLPNFKTVDVLGEARATILTGQVGSIFGVRVVVSQQFDNAAIAAGTLGTPLGCMVNTANFIHGDHRGLRTESALDIVNQKRVLVSTRRFAFRDIIAGEGVVNLEIAT